MRQYLIPRERIWHPSCEDQEARPADTNSIADVQPLLEETLSALPDYRRRSLPKAKPNKWLYASSRDDGAGHQIVCSKSQAYQANNVECCKRFPFEVCLQICLIVALSSTHLCHKAVAANTSITHLLKHRTSQKADWHTRKARSSASTTVLGNTLHGGCAFCERRSMWGI
jgi:hypothetical protein